jgi:hypothetical protein
MSSGAEVRVGVTYRHKKSGRVYEVICNAVMERDKSPVVVYRQLLQHSSEMQRVWVRPSGEFLEKFEDIDTQADCTATASGDKTTEAEDHG